jgi:hypothetical protein
MAFGINELQVDAATTFLGKFSPPVALLALQPGVQPLLSLHPFTPRPGIWQTTAAPCSDQNSSLILFRLMEPALMP